MPVFTVRHFYLLRLHLPCTTLRYRTFYRILPAPLRSRFTFRAFVFGCLARLRFGFSTLTQQLFYSSYYRFTPRSFTRIPLHQLYHIFIAYLLCYMPLGFVLQYCTYTTQPAFSSHFPLIPLFMYIPVYTISTFHFMIPSSHLGAFTPPIVPPPPHMCPLVHITPVPGVCSSFPPLPLFAHHHAMTFYHHFVVPSYLHSCSCSFTFVLAFFTGSGVCCSSPACAIPTLIVSHSPCPNLFCAPYYSDYQPSFFNDYSTCSPSPIVIYSILPSHCPVPSLLPWPPQPPTLSLPSCSPVPFPTAHIPHALPPTFSHCPITLPEIPSQSPTYHHLVPYVYYR